MTNAELLDLLREARQELAAAGMSRASNSSFERERADKKVAQIHARIDAALAERQDKPPCSCGQPYPCMKGCPDCCHSQGYLNYCQGDRHAERQDSATEVHPCMADWHRDICESERSKAQRALFEGAGLEVFFGGHVWRWRTNLGGTCATEAEAKTAAIAAARGMR